MTKFVLLFYASYCSLIVKGLRIQLFAVCYLSEKRKKIAVMDPVVLSLDPLIKLFRNCITLQQQVDLLNLAQKRLTKDTDSGFSSSLYLRQKSDANLSILRDVAMLAGNLSGLPWKLAEPVSLTRYTSSQSYGLHYDSGFTMQGKRMERAATLLLYLNSVPQGGETVFPFAANESSRSFLVGEKPPLTDACYDGSALKIVPEAASCLVFFNHLNNDAGLNPRALHGSCPVINGEKWIAQIWLHDKPWGSGVTDIW